MIKVKNLNGTSGRVPNQYSSWLAFWEAKTGRKANKCSVYACNKTDLVGAHVQKADSSDRSWYIVPICAACNHRVGEFYVTETLVPVNS